MRVSSCTVFIQIFQILVLLFTSVSFSTKCSCDFLCYIDLNVYCHLFVAVDAEALLVKGAGLFTQILL